MWEILITNAAVWEILIFNAAVWEILIFSAVVWEILISSVAVWEVKMRTELWLRAQLSQASLPFRSLYPEAQRLSM